MSWLVTVALMYESWPWHDIVAWVANLILAAVATAGVFIALATLRKLERQTKASEDSAKAQMNADRAWVMASVAGDPAEPLVENLATKGIHPGIVWRLRIFGNTPAKITRTQIRCRIVDCDPANVFQPLLEPAPVYHPDQNRVEGKVVSPPGHTMLVNVPVERVPNIELKNSLYQVQMGGAFLVSYGRVEYQDAFGRNGVTQFCAIYKPHSGGVITSPDGTVLNPVGFHIGGSSAYNYNE
jgi:hypothetical protein